MSTQQGVPRWPSQILLKLYTSVRKNETKKSWKFQLQNLSSSRNIGIQSYNFLKKGIEKWESDIFKLLYLILHFR